MRAMPPAEADASSVCAAIVTYADRFALLRQVLEAVFAEGVATVVVVDNASAAASSQALGRLAASEPRLRVQRFEQNLGSAAGFGHALQVALSTGAQFVWVLDDDNRPVPGALRVLLDFWASSGATARADRVALSSLRADRPSFVAALASAEPEAVLPPRDAFAGFHVGQFFARLRERLVPPSAAVPSPLPAAGRLAACAWGGLFCHRTLLQALPPPDAQYVLYMDDFAFTRAIVERGGEIWLLRDSVLRDLERSSHLPARKTLFYHSVFDTKSDAAVYYGLRNGVFFARQHLVSRPWLYRVNALLYLLLMHTIGALRGQWRRLRIMRDALRDGAAGRLGRHGAYPL